MANCYVASTKEKTQRGFKESQTSNVCLQKKRRKESFGGSFEKFRSSLLRCKEFKSLPKDPNTGQQT